MNTPKRKAVFLDRDGTIIEDRGYLKSRNEAVFFPDAVDALRRLSGDYLLFVVSNQNGIGKGLITAEDAAAVNSYIDGVLSGAGIKITEWYVCPHKREDGCSCMKPSPYFLEKAAADYDLDLSASWIIGDHPHDVETGARCGASGLYVLTGHGARHLGELPPDVPVFHDLTGAAEWICGGMGNGIPNICSVEDGGRILAGGGLVAFPTETVYGLGADVFNPAAVENIFRTKGRPFFDPLIAHVSDLKQMERLCRIIPEDARRLMERFWPGPLTIVLPKKPEVPDVVTGGNDTVAIRMPAHPTARRLISLAGTPIAAPSANAFGRTSPTTALHVVHQLGTKGYSIIDGGACRVGVESTVVSLAGGSPCLLRPGGIPLEQLEEVLGTVETAVKPVLKNLDSPGLLENHYAPKTPLYIVKSLPAENPDPATGMMVFGSPELKTAGPVEYLSRAGSAPEAAANLYAAMRRMDTLGLSRILTVLLPGEGLGRAVNDRIKKAAVKT